MSVSAGDLSSQYLSASAGSGKTFALSLRFCNLLVAGVPPETICALTFTRAATREIFQDIIEKFAAFPHLLQGGRYTPEEALERLLNALPKLQISTIDAFVSKVARLFAYELGLNPDFTLYDSESGVEAQELVRDLVRRALQTTPSRAAETLLRQFTVAYEGLGGGASLTQQLTAFFSAYADLLDRTPAGWGDEAQLTRALASVPRLLSAEERQQAYALVAACADSERFTGSISEAGVKSFRAFIDRYDPQLNSVKESVARTLGADWRKKFFERAQTGRYTYRNKSYVFSEEEAAALRALRDDLLARDLHQSATYAQRLYTAISALAQIAEQQRQETGKLSLAYLVKRLSRLIGARLSVLNPDLFYITYRLDSSIRHLMIDEFQDTSVVQWQALRNLAQELTEEPDGTFFYVGDVKQSIYGWRGGDSTLFGDPGRVPDIPQGAPLLSSYRSAPPIIELVNALMDYSAYPAADRPEAWQQAPLADWKRLWQPHTAVKAKSGYAAVALLEASKPAEYLDAFADFLARRWKELSGRGLQVAVLSFRNVTFSGDSEDPGLLARLRARGVPCAIDGKRPIAETTMGRLILTLLHWLSDPRDTLAREILIRAGLDIPATDEAFCEWTRRIHEQGFAVWLTEIFKCRPSPCAASLSDADREILSAVLQVLDELDSRNCTDAVLAEKSVRAHEIACTSDATVLQLMTVHHSKGLGVDVVFTLVDGSLQNERRVTVESTADWLIAKPSLSETYRAYPQLEAAAQARREARFKDDLCALYVAVTRAKREQIVFLPAPAERGGSLARASLFRASLFRAYAGTGVASPDPEIDILFWGNRFGDERWWEAEPLCADPLPDPPLSWSCVRTRIQPEVELPSARARTAPVADFLAEGADDARLFGISVHDELSAVGWTDTPPRGLFPEVFRKPDEPCDLWRERPFSVKISSDGALRYTAGQFDRVHLFPESRRAVIYDFKTSAVPEATPAYCQQLRDYSRALTALTGYPPESIQLILLFTRSGKAVEVPYV